MLIHSTLKKEPPTSKFSWPFKLSSVMVLVRMANHSSQSVKLLKPSGLGNQHWPLTSKGEKLEKRHTRVRKYSTTQLKRHWSHGSRRWAVVVCPCMHLQ